LLTRGPGCAEPPEAYAETVPVGKRTAPEVQPSDAAAAEERYREAKALAGALEMRPLLAHCHLGLGKLYRRTGKHEQAREHLAIATTMFREMEMRFWLEQAEAELAAVR